MGDPYVFSGDELWRFDTHDWEEPCGENGLRVFDETLVNGEL